MDAAIECAEPGSYLAPAGFLEIGEPLALPKVAQSHRPRSFRANDLIGELREISGQVHRMMGQVQRAIDHLAVHAGQGPNAFNR